VSLGLIIVIAAVVVIAVFVLLTFNRMVGKRQATENSWAQIDVALRRRHDLIPTLVESVKGYAAHERGTFESVTQARATAVADATQAPPQRAAAEDTLKRATDRLLVVAENYPELEATKNFSQLADNLRETEDQIAITRRVYNDTVETYNTLIQVFPALIVAKLFGFSRREFFDAPAGSEATPDVDLSPAAPPPAPGPA
jgi:LemA protein